MRIEDLIAELKEIYQEMLDLEPVAEHLSQTVHPDFRPSARNLIRYLSLRNHDLRPLHDPLSDLGLSSLRTAEGYVLTNLHRVLQLLHLDDQVNHGLVIGWLCECRCRNGDGQHEAGHQTMIETN